MNIWKKLFGSAQSGATVKPKPEASAKPLSVNSPVPPSTAPVSVHDTPPTGTNSRLPKAARLYVVGNGFVPEKDQIIFAAKGFFFCHKNLDRESVLPDEMEGLLAFGGTVAQFCEVALSVVFDDDKHPGAYYLDAVLVGRQACSIAEMSGRQFQSSSEQMMAVMVWEGENAKTVKEQISGGKTVD